MARDPYYDILFEPVTIGPVTAKNRFYQPPHCNGMGEFRPHMHAAMRGTKAEGGWAVINTEHCSISPTDDLLGEIVQTLWDDDDIPNLALMVDSVHEHGALAGIQLAHSSYYSANRMSREVVMGPDARPVAAYDPVQGRAMDKRDIQELLPAAGQGEPALEIGRLRYHQYRCEHVHYRLSVSLAAQSTHR